MLRQMPDDFSATRSLPYCVVKLLEEWEKKGLKDKKAALEFLIKLGHKTAIELERNAPKQVNKDD